MGDKDITHDELMSVCDKVIEAMCSQKLDPLHFGKAVFALFISGCASAKMDDATIDRVLARAKRQIIIHI